jgi:glycosyltransferase involved in cell wall biosynthesis
VPAFNFVERKTGIPFPIPTLRALRTVRNEVRHADVVMLQDCLYLTNMAAYLFARRAGIPVILVQHIGLVPYSNRLLSGMMRLANALVTRPMLAGAQQVVFISEITKQYFRNTKFRTPPEVIFNGVNTEVFHPLEVAEQKNELRRQLGLPSDVPVVLFVGRFVEKKGLPIFKHMVEMTRRFTWAFAGWGPLDPSEWNAPNVRVFSDLHDSRLADLYHASDIFVLPSTGEGFPLVVQEALATGLKVVCALETAGADPAMRPMVHGVGLYPGDDARSARALLAAIEEHIGSGAGPDQLAEERRKFVLSHYSWRHAAERYLEIAARLAPQARCPQRTESANGLDADGPGDCPTRLGRREASP